MSVDNNKVIKRKKGEADSMQTKCLRINTYKKSWINFQESNLFCPTNMMRIIPWKDLRGHPDHTRWPSDHSNIPKLVVPEKELDPNGLILLLFPALPCLNLQGALKWILILMFRKYTILCIHFFSCVCTPCKSIFYLQKSALWHASQRQDSVGKNIWERL